MERIWRLLHSKPLTNSFRETYTDFRESIIKFFRKIILDKNDDWIPSLVDTNFQEFDGNLII